MDYEKQITVDEARKSGELISVGDSQILRSLRSLLGRKDSSEIREIIEQLFSERKRIKKRKFSHENLIRLKEIDNEINSLLFVPEIVSVSVNDIRHYEYIGKNGFLVNGRKYVRLLCGSGQARRNTALFIDERYEKPLKEILNNGRNPDITITPAKFSAYFALASSATLEVSTPYVCVVPDCEVIRKERVDFIEELENDDDLVEEREMDIPFNLWDGQGVISPRLAKLWAEELKLDYIPSAFIIRANFIKGMVATFDFHEFSESVAEKHIITDIWGNKVNLRDMDIILTQSQFKLWDSFDSMDAYLSNCKKNGLSWGISRVAPKKENKYTFLNYQFIQALNITTLKQIEKLCKPTLDYFELIINSINDPSKIANTFLYLMGKMADIPESERGSFNLYNSVQDNVTKALALDNRLIEDPYVKKYLIHSLNKKIRESYYGNLLIDGYYTLMVSDPYAFMEYVFGMEVKGLLGRGEHYCKHWIEKGRTKIAAMRAPLTWRSEVNILSLKNTLLIEKWYKYMGNSVIYNVFGLDCLIAGGSDYDGDIVCVTDNDVVVEGAFGGLPIYYTNKKASKQVIVEDDLYLSDIDGFNSKVGFITNVATTAFAMLEMFPKDSPEYIEIIKRLKRFRKEQGSTIDATKGLEIKPFPIHWTKYNMIEDGMSDEEKELQKFKNRIVIDKRPYFMRWLYGSYRKQYRNHLESYDQHSIMKFDKPLQEILDSKEWVDAELEFIDKFYRFSPLLNSDCVMNRICNYMESKIHEIKTLTYADNMRVMKSRLQTGNPTNKERYQKLYDLYRQYRSKKNFLVGENDEKKFKTAEQYNKYIRQIAYQISSDSEDLANWSVEICYETHKNDNKTFVWHVFGSDIINNLYKKHRNKTVCYLPFIDDDGPIEFLGKRYSMQAIPVGSVDEGNYNAYLE